MTDESEPRFALDDAGDVTLPVIDVLTGRAFVTGKSGSGKSNSANVIAEELLERGYPLMIVDTDGEYWGLKEEYEMLRVGADEECDAVVGPEHGEWLAERALEDGIPIILDVSGFIDEDEADELVFETFRHLFSKGKTLKRPYLTIVEEIHEYIPQKGSQSQAGQMLVKLGKRGRKHGLGLCGISQRPADVKKDFITQCDWLLWHRLTWDTDTKVVRRVVDAATADAVEDLDDGEAFLQADFLSEPVQRVRVRRMETFDAGATPDLEGFDRPDLLSVDESLLGDLEEISQQQDRREDRIEVLESQVEDLEDELQQKDQRIQRLLDLREMVESVDGIDSAGSADQNGTRAGGDVVDEQSVTPETVTVEMDGQSIEMPEEIRAEVLEIRDENEALTTEIERKDARIADLENKVADLESEVDAKAERIAELEQVAEQREVLEEATTRMADALGMDVGGDGEVSRLVEQKTERIETLEAEKEDLEAEVEELRAELSRQKKQIDSGVSGGSDESGSDSAAGGSLLIDDDLATLLDHEAVQAAISTAQENSKAADEHHQKVLSALATSGEARAAADVAGILDVSERTVREVLNSLHTAGVLRREGKRPATYRIDREFLEQRIEVAQRQEKLTTALDSEE